MLRVDRQQVGQSADRTLEESAEPEALGDSISETAIKVKAGRPFRPAILLRRCDDRYQNANS